MKYELSLFLWVASIKHPQKWSIANGWRLHSPWQSMLIMQLKRVRPLCRIASFHCRSIICKIWSLSLVHCWFSKKGGRIRSLVVSVSWIISQPILVPFQWQPTGKGCASGVYLSNESRPSASSWCHCQPVHQMLGLPQCHLLVWQDLSLGWSAWTFSLRTSWPSGCEEEN